MLNGASSNICSAPACFSQQAGALCMPANAGFFAQSYRRASMGFSPAALLAGR